MSTTLSSLAWLFIDDVSGQGRTTDSRLDPRDIILKIRQLMNEVMDLKYFEKYNDGDRGAITLYISTYKLTMQHDADLNRAYVIIPDFYKTQSYNRGIHRAWRKEFPDNDIVISHHPQIGGNTRAGNVANIVYGFMEGFNLVFRNISVEPDDEPEIVVVQTIVAAPDAIGANDPLPIIPEQQAEILRRLMAMYRPTPQDLAINANQSV